MEKIILGLCKEEVPVKKICFDLNIDIKRFYEYINRLQRSGTNFFQHINNDGEIVLCLSKVCGDEDPIILKVNNGEFVFGVSADYHVGSAYSNMPNIYMMQNFFSANSIETHAFLGDLIDGFPKHFSNIPGREESLEKQIEDAVKYFPYVHGPNIYVPGDHDTRYKTNDGYSILKALKSLRKDLKIYSSGLGVLNINGVEFALCHDVNNPHVNKEAFDNRFVISAHSHESRTKNTLPLTQLPRFVISPLCDLATVNHRVPGFYVFRLEFDGLVLKTMYAEFYAFYNNQIMSAGTQEFFFQKDIASAPTRKQKGKK